MPPSSDPHSVAFNIDRKHLQQVKSRFLALNNARRQRTREGLNYHQQLLLELLPLLFHVNHPLLPGYVSAETPAGICGYKPEKNTLKEAKRLARSFRFHPLSTKQEAIHALFLMGSIGTVGQSTSSDLDVWLCYDQKLTAEEQQALQDKCAGITAWGKTLGLEVTFFCMNTERFAAGETLPLSDDSSGSAQHYLLLDEFYRSAIHLAGRLPLWWFVPVEHDVHYSDYRQQLLGKRFMRESELIDLGKLDHIPLLEFVSAGIWQLYKGIEAPYKSVLKLLLLEVYAHQYPRGLILAQQFKQAIYQDNGDIDQLDPYQMLYRALEQYLLQKKQTQRLELVRRCFYFKVNKPLTRAPRNPHTSWQRQHLQQRVEEWQWSQQQLKSMDHRHQWRTLQVSDERQRLVAELLGCYRVLSEFARNAASPSHQLQSELSVLGRKLYAAFERKAGKIEWINPSIASDLSEPSLIFQAKRRDGSTLQTSALQWQLMALLPHEAHSEQLNPRCQLKQSSTLGELLTWAYCNGIWSEGTRIELRQPSGSPLTPTDLWHTFAQWQPLPPTKAKHSVFLQKPYPKQLLLLANLSGTEAPLFNQRQQSAQTDAFNYTTSEHSTEQAPQPISLLRNIELVVRNSWDEVLAHSFDSLAAMVTKYLRLTPTGEQRPPQLTIYCRTSNQSQLLKQRLEQLFALLTTHFYSNTASRSSRVVIEKAGGFLAWQFLNGQPQLFQTDCIDNLINWLGRPQPTLSPIILDTYCLPHHPLKAVTELHSHEAIQICYRALGDRAEVYVLDEKGALFFRVMPLRDSESLLRTLHRFIRSAVDRQCLIDHYGDHHFGVFPVEFFELCGNVQQGYKAEQRHVTADLSNLQFFNIQAIADLDAEGNIAYSIYCDQQEFHASQLGEKLYKRAASYILARRSLAERYPCYITDLDLSRCQHLIGEGQPLQVSHYLRIKSELEERLNLALQQI